MAQAVKKAVLDALNQQENEFQERQRTSVSIKQLWIEKF